MLNKEIIRENFSKSARDYDRHAFLQRSIAKELCSLIPQRPYKRILDIGCGTGYLTFKLAELFPQAEVIGIDLAPGMIEVAKEKSNFGNVHFLISDAEELNFPVEFFDLVVSSSSLQWMDYKKVFWGTERILTENGVFCFSTFGPRTLWEMNVIGFKVEDFVSLETLLALLSNFEIIDSYSKVVKETFSSVKELVNYLKEIGAYFTEKEKKRKFDSFSALRNYREKFGTKASFETIFVCASRRKS